MCRGFKSKDLKIEDKTIYNHLSQSPQKHKPLVVNEPLH